MVCQVCRTLFRICSSSKKLRIASSWQTLLLRAFATAQQNQCLPGYKPSICISKANLMLNTYCLGSREKKRNSMKPETRQSRLVCNMCNSPERNSSNLHTSSCWWKLERKTICAHEHILGQYVCYPRMHHMMHHTTHKMFEDTPHEGSAYSLWNLRACNCQSECQADQQCWHLHALKFPSK